MDDGSIDGRMDDEWWMDGRMDDEWMMDGCGWMERWMS